MGLGFGVEGRSIGGIDFCEVTKECVLERNAYLKLKIGFFLGNLSALA
jgi:hypothetical protein